MVSIFLSFQLLNNQCRKSDFKKLYYCFQNSQLMKILHVILIVFLLIATLFSCKKKEPVANEFTGSGSCIECHSNFYELWSTSHHGKAMQPLSKLFLQTEKLPASEDFLIEGKNYRIVFTDSTMTMVETTGGQTVNYPVNWVLGGKNVFYFLTPLERGKLQTIPLAYNLNSKSWYNNPQSALRHFPEGPADQALPWKDRMYNFNTSCYSCHVSQLESNFDLASDSYNSVWKEAGINCETCHGPSSEHVRIFKSAKKGEEVENLALISTNTFSADQHNWSCVPCHAKMRPITASYLPGDRYFDNYDLTVLDNTDFYPDGRDLGENYTYTGWMMNECAANSELHCVTCHTSSGRDRFKNNPNDACKKCHGERVANVAEHSGHKPDSQGSVCINCHMPKTMFGAMNRSDHSFRPPMPEATIRFSSPNACNMCHTDKTPQWANNVVKKRKNGNYQNETSRWATILNSARQEDWRRLDEMLQIIRKNELNEVVVASFVRVLDRCPKPEKWPVVIEALQNPSPLVRASVANGLAGNNTDAVRAALIKAAADEYRLVRVSAAFALAQFPAESFSAAEKAVVENATAEYLQSMITRPDDWSSHYNLGLFYQNRGENDRALGAYDNAARLYPESLMPLINSSVLYSQVGNPAKAEENLKSVLQIDPANEAANLNYGLLLAENGRTAEAEQALKNALQANPAQAVAAYNLSVIVSQRSMKEAVEYAKIATTANQQEPKYGYTLAFYQLQNNQKNEAIKTLRGVLQQFPQYLNAVSLLADTYARDGKPAEAIKVYQQALKAGGITEQDRAALTQAIAGLQQSM
ncbi:MAG TPA: hypothetical protein DER09_03205 [Prolixibacteraceae bacterium]|nr:hypothetical protein [Prolixibacteraceae bacterium]